MDADALAAALAGSRLEDFTVHRKIGGKDVAPGGVLHRIGTDHGRRAWASPHTDGKVIAALSSDGGHGFQHKVVGRSDDG